MIRQGAGTDVTLYLMGDGVLCARRSQKGYHSHGIEEALKNGARVCACSRDLKARGISAEDRHAGIESPDDFESILIEDVMENAGRVFSW